MELAVSANAEFTKQFWAKANFKGAYLWFLQGMKHKNIILKTIWVQFEYKTIIKNLITTCDQN